MLITEHGAALVITTAAALTTLDSWPASVVKRPTHQAALRVFRCRPRGLMHWMVTTRRYALVLLGLITTSPTPLSCSVPQLTRGASGVLAQIAFT